MAEIARLLSDPTCRLLTLVGPGGAGKTRLALEAAAGQREAFTDGVHFVPLQPLYSPDYFVTTIAESVGLPIHQAGDPKQQLLNGLGNKRLLLVMDNFEHLLEGAGIVSDILARAPAVKVIATSREALNLQEEHLWPVSGMRFPKANGATADADRPLEAYSAVKLFTQSAHRIRADFSLAEELAGVIRICQLVDGMPLGIELASAWVRVLSCDEIAREIERSLDFLETHVRNVPPRHRSMRAVLDHSWSLLTEAEREVLKRLSVFRGGFTRGAVQEITGASLPALSALVDKSLLRREESGRYTLHDMVCQYASEHLHAAPGEYAAARERHCAYFMTFVQQQWDDMRGSRPKEAMAAIDDELDNVRVAWLWAVEQRREAEIDKALDSLWFYYDSRGRYQEGERAFSKAAEALGADSPVKQKSMVLGRVLVRLGVLCNSLSQYEQAKALIEAGLRISRRYEVAEEIALGLTRLGEVHAFAENFAKDVRHFFHDSLAIYEEIGDKWGMAFALNWLANLTDGPEGERYSERSLALFQEVGSQWGVAIRLPCMAFQAVDRADYDLARQLAEQGYAACSDIGIGWGAAMALEVLGSLHYETGQYSEALQFLERALKKAVELHLARYVAYAAYTLSLVMTKIGQRALAIDAAALCLRTLMYQRGWGGATGFEGALPSDIIEAALERSKTLDPDAAVKALLADLAALRAEAGALPSPALAASQPLDEPLTERELEILHLIAEGMSNRQIAEALVLSLGTVKWYVSQIYSKLQVSSRTQAVAHARELKLIS